MLGRSVWSDRFPGFKDGIDVLDSGGAEAECGGDEEAEHIMSYWEFIIFRLNLFIYKNILADFFNQALSIKRSKVK